MISSEELAVFDVQNDQLYDYYHGQHMDQVSFVLIVYYYQQNLFKDA